MVKTVLRLFFVVVLLTGMMSSVAAPLKLSKDTFLRGINQRELSTSTSDEGDEVRLMITEPFYIGESKVIDKGAIMVGVIESIKMPVQETNGSLKVRIDKLISADGSQTRMRGYIWSGNKNVLGGELTPPLYYNKVAHYSEWKFGDKGGVLQYAPSGMHYFGAHTVVKAGALLNVVLLEDLYLKEINQD